MTEQPEIRPLQPIRRFDVFAETKRPEPSLTASPAIQGHLPQEVEARATLVAIVGSRLPPSPAPAARWLSRRRLRHWGLDRCRWRYASWVT